MQSNNYINFKKNITLFLLFIIFLPACTKKIEYVINNGTDITTDSILIYKVNSLKIISIGDRITTNPLVSQIYDENNSIKYILLDDNNLHIFDYNSGNLEKSISINSSLERGCGILNNYSGFYYHSLDSIFIYNYKVKMVFLIDSESNIKKKWNVVNNQLAKYPVDPEALTSSPIVFYNGYILLSGSGNGQPNDATESNKPVSCLININNDSLKYVVGYPEQYRRGNFGGVYFNTIYHTNVDGSAVMYSFPADHNVYLFNCKLLKMDTLYAGSRNIKYIESSPLNFLDLYIDKNKRIEYYVKQPSYGNIIYDKYRELYYRIARVSLLDWKSTDVGFRKPFSIITISKKGKILSETPIFKDYKILNLNNIHVVPDGIIIQTDNNKEENNLYFNLYKIKKL